jgi:hypothetical protein
MKQIKLADTSNVEIHIFPTKTNGGGAIVTIFAESLNPLHQAIAELKAKYGTVHFSAIKLTDHRYHTTGVVQ